MVPESVTFVSAPTSPVIAMLVGVQAPVRRDTNAQV